MSYWITTHYPHQTIGHPYHVYLKEKYLELLGRSVQVGDSVAFYELKGKGGGRQEVIALARVSGPIEPNTNHDGGPDTAEQRWEWQFPCDSHEYGGSVSKEELFRVLGWNERRQPLVPGGLIPLKVGQYEQVVSLFRRALRR